MTVLVMIMTMAMIMVTMMMTACEPDTHKHKQDGECFHDCLSLLIDKSNKDDITFRDIR